MKKSLCVLTALLSLSLLSCKEEGNEPKQEEQQQQQTNTDAKSDDGRSEADSKSDDDAASEDDAQSEEDDIEPVLACMGASSYSELPSYGKVKLGYPCNIDGDCEGENSFCDLDAYFCNTYDEGATVPMVTAKNLPEFSPCFNDDQCATGHCANIEENLNICTFECVEGASSNGFFSCVKETNGDKYFCEPNLEKDNIYQGKECVHDLFDCGWDATCEEGKCMLDSWKDLVFDTVTDRLGDVYTTVKIGDQIWTTQNIRYEGSSGKMSIEGLDPAEYGYLYYIYDAEYACSSLGNNPGEWRLPTAYEYLAFIGDDLELETAYDTWVFQDNETWILPGNNSHLSIKYTESYENDTHKAFLWTSTNMGAGDDIRATYLWVSDNQAGIAASTDYADHFSVRCVKDIKTSDEPIVKPVHE